MQTTAQPVVQNAWARIGIRATGIIIGAALGVFLSVVLSIITSLMGVVGTFVSPLIGPLLGWLAAEVAIWVAVRRAPALPSGERPEMPDELPLLEPVSQITTRYPSTDRLRDLPARTPDPATRDEVRRLSQALREEYSVEVAYQRVDRERMPAARAHFEYERALAPIALTAERNAAIAVTILVSFGLVGLVTSGFRFAFGAILTALFTWFVLKLVRRHVMPRHRRPAVSAESPASVVPFTSSGIVGGNLAGATGEFGQANVDLGTAGEIRTARLLDSSLAGITRTAVFHSLRFPGLDRADVDHVVLIDTATGPVLIVVDSKAWKPGTWVQFSAAEVRHDDSDEVRKSLMPLAVSKFVAEGFTGRAMTVIHASSGAVTVLGNQEDAHLYVDSETLVASILESRATAPPLRTEAELEKFRRLTADLRRRLVG